MRLPATEPLRFGPTHDETFHHVTRRQVAPVISPCHEHRVHAGGLPSPSGTRQPEEQIPARCFPPTVREHWIDSDPAGKPRE